MRILVTGITGFIGSRLWEHLTPEDEIYVLVRKATWKPIARLERLNVTVLEGDLSGERDYVGRSGNLKDLWRELENIRPEVCIHLAWEGIPDLGYINSINNLNMSCNFFQHLVNCGCKKIISTGSCFEYGRRFGSCHEYNTLEIKSSFAWAKHSLMNFGMMLAKKHSIDFIWARLFYVYGLGQRPEALIPYIYSKLRTGEPLVIKTPHDEIDLIHVEDVARALVQMTKINGQSIILNIGSGESIPIWKVCEIIEESMGIEPRASEFLRSTDEPEFVTDFWANIGGIGLKINWEPKISVEEGIRDYIKNTT